MLEFIPGFPQLAANAGIESTPLLVSMHAAPEILGPGPAQELDEDAAPGTNPPFDKICWSLPLDGRAFPQVDIGHHLAQDRSFGICHINFKIDLHDGRSNLVERPQ